ncbi:hypothetical protein F8M41_005509 [Gigaspora margarita]|uniref:Uncharacterized protein n=1 Tax=Gigaspora margarita TaxID=4874 RepID=A0A8H4AX83_GIGMA|nr:hypothetical protein F8M41_005509 [Gigaspora margarita]
MSNISTYNNLFSHIKSCLLSFSSAKKLSISSKKLTDHVNDIIAITLGIRAAYLIDFAFLTLDDSKTLLSSFQKNKNLFNICILQFSDTHTFICNHKLVLTKLENDLINEFKNCIFVDIMWNYKETGCKEPEMIDTPLSFKKSLEMNVKPFFLEWSDIDSSSLTTKLAVFFIPKTPTCIITFTGWILEYPVVYVLDSAPDNVGDIFDIQMTKNCLGGQNLKLYRVFLKNAEKVHNSRIEDSGMNNEPLEYLHTTYF